METEDRRREYRIAVKLLAYVALTAIAFIFITSLFSRDNEATSVRIDLAGLTPGEVMFHDWNRRKLLVLHRTPEMLALLEDNSSQLYDPQSRFSQQPKAMTNPYRSVRPEIFVAIAAGTDLNCELELVADTGQAAGQEPIWAGGFRDLCRGSRYDFAGRVLRGEQAKRNLLVPDYRFDNNNRLVIRGE